MAGRKAADVALTKRQRSLLERWVRSGARTPHRLIERCRIVLMSADGLCNKEQGRRLGVDRQRMANSMGVQPGKALRG